MHKETFINTLKNINDVDTLYRYYSYMKTKVDDSEMIFLSQAADLKQGELIEKQNENYSEKSLFTGSRY